MNSRRRIGRILIAACVLTACLIPVSVQASDHVFHPGHKHVDVDILQAPGSEEIEGQAGLPPKLDPRGESWYKNSISVRDQADSNLCWAFSSTSAAQISYAKELYESTGSAGSVASSNTFLISCAVLITHPLQNNSLKPYTVPY